MKTANTAASTRHQYRMELKKRRQQLTRTEQTEAAQQLVAQVMQQPEVTSAQTVGAYFSFAAELNTAPLLQALIDAGKTVCLPVLHPFVPGHLLMLRYDQNTQLVSNRFAIPEPRLRCSDVIPFAQLDTLLVPLVGFDRNGNRLGMGGGYYDRTLAGWSRGHYLNLSVAGLAHDCQQVEKLPTQAWDVPLPAVFTPTRCWRFPNRPL